MHKTTIAIGLCILTICSYSLTYAENYTNLPSIYISEINNQATSELEWVEIVNNSNIELQISELFFLENQTKHKITHPTRTTILPQEIIIIANNQESVSNLINNTEQIFDSAWGSLNLSGEEIGIIYHDQIVDQLIYPEVNSDTDGTLQRLSQNEFEFKNETPLYTDLITNIQTNPETESTKPKEKHIAIISEISPNSSNDFIELFFSPSPDDELNLKDWLIINDGNLFQFEETIINEPQFITIKLNDINKNLTSTNENITLLNSNSEIIDAVCWHNKSTPEPELDDKQNLNTEWLGDCINSELIEKEFSIGRKSLFDTNKSTDWQIYAHPTPEQINESRNSSPTAIITIQSGSTVSTESIKVNPSGANSHDPDNDKLTFEWQLNDQIISTEPNPPSINISQKGNHKLQLKVTDNSGANSTETITLSIIDKPKPIIETKIEEKIIEKETVCKAVTSDNTQIEQKNSTTVAGLNNPTTENKSLWQNIKIDSFLANPEGEDTHNEWIKIKNIGTENFELKQWQIDDEDGGSKPYTIPTQTINSGQTIQLTNKETKISLNNTSDSVRLIAPDNTVYDQFTYEKVAENEIIYTNHSQLAQTNLVANTISDTTPTSTIQTTKITPAKLNNNSYTNIKITEIMPNPDGNDQNAEWVEIFNPNPEAVNLEGWTLKVNDKNHKLNLTIEPNNYQIIDSSNSKLTLPNSNATLNLINSNQQTVSTVPYENAKEGYSYTILEDSNQNKKWEWLRFPTPKEPNPTLELIMGILHNTKLDQSKLLIDTHNDKFETVSFAKGQIPTEAIENIKLYEYDIQLRALNVRGGKHLYEIINLHKSEYIEPVTPSKKITIIKYLIAITTTALLTYLISNKPLQDKLTNLIKNSNKFTIK